MAAKKVLIASVPFMVAMFGGMITASAAQNSAIESAWPVVVSRGHWALAASMAVLTATEVSGGWQARAVRARTARQLWARIGLSEEGRRRIYPPDSALGKFLNLERETGSHLASYTWRLVTVRNGT